jgi:hypothetical protein
MPYAFDSIDPARTATIAVDVQDDFMVDGAPFSTAHVMTAAELRELVGKHASV